MKYYYAVVLKSRLQTNVFVNNSLLDMYTKCGCIEEAKNLFDNMPERTVASWTSMISGYCHNGLPDEGVAKNLFFVLCHSCLNVLLIFFSSFPVYSLDFPFSSHSLLYYIRFLHFSFDGFYLL
ncbi:hypothetical protein J1N35_001458 [Gossypium stocksii]|uniref:Pentatricopeptide repeat-containing protein n=1 Tax=Gossypium stocksii TaxID=47602 RepID=A0A9D4AJM6_9ROSI|nr:hypothetical protein J1N35_001458 [Gossypium stocksii]